MLRPIVLDLPDDAHFHDGGVGEGAGIGEAAAELVSVGGDPNEGT